MTGVLALTRLTARIALVNAEQTTSTTYDDVAWLLNLDGCADFHVLLFCRFS